MQTYSFSTALKQITDIWCVCVSVRDSLFIFSEKNRLITDSIFMEQQKQQQNLSAHLGI